MLSPEAILQASATMIVGILVVVTLAKHLELKLLGRITFMLTLFGVLPFSISAILALFELVEPATFVCMGGFLWFAVLLLGIAIIAYEPEKK